MAADDGADIGQPEGTHEGSMGYAHRKVDSIGRSPVNLYISQVERISDRLGRGLFLEVRNNLF